MNIARLYVKMVFLTLSLITAPALGAGLHGGAQSRYLIRQTTSSPAAGVRELVGRLNHSGFDVAGVNLDTGEVEVITDDAGIAALNRGGIHGRVLARQGQPGVLAKPDSKYYTSEKIEKALQDLNAAYPRITRLEKLGESMEGRAIWGLLISDTPEDGNPAALEKPSIIVDGMHHAREIMTPEIVMDMAQVLAQAGGLAGWNVWLVPMLNVDGNHIVWTKDNFWRKNAHAEKSQVFGVDINRNYPFNWDGCDGSSGSKSAQDYRGASAGSETETQALVRLADRVKPSANISYHSYSELVLYPLGCDEKRSGEHDLLAQLGGEMAKLLPKDAGKGNYTPGTPWEILYSVDGDSIGYMHGVHGALSYVFEVNQSFQPSYSLREPTVLKHRKAWTHFLGRIQHGALKIKVVDQKGAPYQDAVISVSTIKHVQGERDFKTNSAGNFFKVLEAGKYEITAKLPDGREAKMEVTTMGAAQEVTIAL